MKLRYPTEDPADMKDMGLELAIIRLETPNGLLSLTLEAQSRLQALRAERATRLTDGRWFKQSYT